MLAFIASVESMHDSDCNSDSDDDEFTDEQRVEFLSNLVVEHERLIKSCMKNNVVLKLIKIRLMCLMLKRLIYLRKLD